MIQKNAFDIRFKAPGWARRPLGLPAKSVKGRSNSDLEPHPSEVCSSPDSGHARLTAAGPLGAMMYGPGRALQDRSSKTDERESCNNVSGL